MLAATRRVKAPTPGGLSLRPALVWWLPVVLVGVYVVFVAINLGSIVNHTWWSADSAAAGVLGGLFHQPPAGQYVIIGDHGWYEAAAFYILTSHLPAQRAIWYSAPVIFWAITIGLIAASTVRAFGRWAGAIAAAALLCMSPVGLMVVFEPTAHTNSLLHAAVLVLVTGWVIPRVGSFSMRRLVAIGLALGLFSGLAVAGDSVSLIWGAVPFAVTVLLCGWRGRTPSVGRTATFGLVTLGAVFVGAAIFSGIMHGVGLRIDQLAQKHALSLSTPAGIWANLGTLLRQGAGLIGGDFFGHALNFIGIVELVSGLMLFAAAGSVVFVTRRQVVAAGPRPDGGSERSVTVRMVHVSFWATCAFAGVLAFMLGTPGAGGYRYLLGPVAAVCALLPLLAIRGDGWRIALATGLSAVAIASVIQMIDFGRMPYVRNTLPVSGNVVRQVSNFATRWHARFGYAAYWDAMTLTWFSGFRVVLYEVEKCNKVTFHYCPRYQVSFTDAYKPRPGTRTLFVADRNEGYRRPASVWGKPLAKKRIGRLTVYVYSYDIAEWFPPTSKDEIQRVITGNGPKTGSTAANG